MKKRNQSNTIVKILFNLTKSKWKILEVESFYNFPVLSLITSQLILQIQDRSKMKKLSFKSQSLLFFKELVIKSKTTTAFQKPHLVHRRIICQNNS